MALPNRAFLFSQDRVSLGNIPGCPGTCFVDQAGLELIKLCLPASASQVLGLKVWAPPTGPNRAF